MEDDNQADDPNNLYPWFKLEPYTQMDEQGVYRLLGSKRTNLEAMFFGLEARIIIFSITGTIGASFLNFIWFVNPIWIPLSLMGHRLGRLLYHVNRYDFPLADEYFCDTFHGLIDVEVLPLVFLLTLQYLNNVISSFILRCILLWFCTYVIGNSLLSVLSLPLDNWKHVQRMTSSLFHDWYIGIASNPGRGMKVFLWLQLVHLGFSSAISIVFVAMTYALKPLWKVGQILISMVFANFSSALPGKLPEPLFTDPVLIRQNIYTPIAADREFRLLELEKWRPFRPVQMRLLHATLDNAPPYEAISYCWGNAAKTHKILINGHVMLIPKATYDVLYGRSRWKNTRRIWIDAVCIDQSNNDEKSKQVQMMKHVYAMATRVIIWLRGSAFAAFPAVALLQDMLRQVKKHKLSGEQIAENFRFERLGFRWRCLERLLSQDFFFRVWVMQEVAAAKSVEVVCGGLYIDFEMLRELSGLVALEPDLGTLFRTGPTGEACYRAMSHLETMARIGKFLPSVPRYHSLKLALVERQPTLLEAKLLESLEPIKNLCILHLLLESRAFQATDPRDKIYSLFGLALDYPRRSRINVRSGFDPIIVDLTPDYSRTTYKVYLDLARHFLSSTTPFSILGRAGLGYRNENSIKGLPLWAPDWTHTPQCAPLVVQLGDAELQYAACGKSQHQVEFLGDKFPHICLIKSVRLSSIKAIGGVCPSQIIGGEEEEDFLSANGKYTNMGQSLGLHAWHEEALTLALHHARPLPVGNAGADVIAAMDMLEPSKTKTALLMRSFWRTLCGEKTATKHPAPESFARDYADWVRLLDFIKKDHDSAFGSHKDTFKSSRDSATESKNLVVPGLDVWRQIYALAAWGSALGLVSAGRQFFVTTDGHMGLAPPGTKVGDQVFVFAGAPTPFVLRNYDGWDEGRWKGRDDRTGGAVASAISEPADHDTTSANELTEFEPSNVWQLVGECYLNGFMNGEAFKGEDVPFEQVALT